MFSVDCSGHGSPVLLGNRSIERLVNTDQGIELHWRCRCGTTGTVLTGRAAEGWRQLRSQEPSPPASSASGSSRSQRSMQSSHR